MLNWAPMAQSTQSARVIRFGAFEVDVRSGELRKHGVRLKLRDQPFQILIMLLERSGEVVTREELRQRLWPADTFVDFDHGLNTAVNKLRESLGDSAGTPRYIETLARRGYRFIGPVPTFIGPPAEPAVAGSILTVAGSIVAQPAPARQLNDPKQLADDELPNSPRLLVRVLFALAQLMYLTFYLIALMRIEDVFASASVLVPGSGRVVWTVVVTTAAIGIPVRLYLLTAVAFDYQPLGRKFFRLLPLIFALDWMWALAPFLLAHKIGNGLAIAACGALLYLPFSERTLIRMSYQTRTRAVQPPSSPLAGL
jgi:cholera toxin transcriptional activator